MPNWKKVIVSGSDAALNSLYAPSITGSLLGTASYATTASYALNALTASFAATASSALNAQDVLIYVKNVTGVQIDKGSVVRISGATGDNALISTASYDSDGLSANTLGITNQDIPHDSFGYVMTEGRLLGINTNAFSAGQLLYLGATGSIIGTAPVAPLHSVRLGQVLRVQTNNGSMYVRIDNGYELGELHDVVDTTTTSSYGDLLVKSGSIWINSKQLTGSYGVTGSFSVQGSIDSSNKWLIGLGAMPGTTSTAVDWNSRVLYDTTGTTTSIDWQTRTLANSTGGNNVDWENRYLYGPGPIPTSTEIAVDWNARQLLNSNGNIILDWGDSSPQFSGTASFATSASWAPGGGALFPYTGSAEITGSLGVTGSFSVLNSIDATNKILIGSGPIPGSTANSVDWGSRTLFDTNGNFSVRWGLLRSLYDANASQSVDWNNRLLKFDNGPGDYTVNWSAGLLRDTGSTNSVDWQNRITIDTGNKTSIDWQNRQLKDSSGNENLNWSSGIKITGSALVSGSLTVTGSLTVSGSSTFTNIGPARFSGSFVVQGDLIPGFPPFIPNVGPYDAIKVDDIAGQRILYGSPLQGASASIDFGNRTLFDNNALDTISWGGTGGEFSTFKYNAQQISATTRDNLYSNNRQGGQFLNDSYFDINVVDNDLVYLNTDGQWYQVDQTTNSSTKMLGIAKSVSSQTGSVLIEGDIVVSSGAGFPLIANPGYGAPIYIKQGAGTAMDTTTPASGYIRLLGYCYASYNGGTDWIMKFRPSNEWYVI